ncbi:T6SS immunity phospholipase A1-binding lipoprotein Tli1-KP, partial [Klebsiella pneumoniae]
MKSALISPLLAGLLLLTGCAQPAAQAGGGGGGTIKAINHTKWAINHFSVNGQSGIDIIGPFQGGGGGCCFSVPARWTPGMTVRVD